jgi:general nucleoside transport system ATP-binding protein
VTVIRKGASIETLRASEVTEQGLADLMVGRHVKLGSLPRQAEKFGDTVAELRDVSSPRHPGSSGLSQFSLRLRAGEILGVAGCEGNGQNDLFRSLRDPVSVSKWGSGRVSLFGQPADELGASEVRRMPVAIVPGDRLREAVLPDETLLENDLLGHDADFAVGPDVCPIFVDAAKARSRLRGILDEYDVRPADTTAVLGGLSGGNQQKFVMARELSRDPLLLLVAQPTRGVDVGSIEKIYREILRRRDQGAAVLLISSQLDELMELSDRIIVIYEGRVVAEFPRGQFDEGAIGLAMGGVVK